MPTFEFGKTLRRTAIGVAMSVLFAAAVVVPRAAVARIGPCRSAALLAGDDERVIAAARRSLPRTLTPVISSRCLDQDRAYAQVTTQRVSDRTGVTHWWVADCHRDSRDWICAPPEFEKEIEQRVTIDGIERRVATTIDSGTALQSAQSLVTRALRMYVNPEWILPYCGGRKDGESRWQTVRKEHPLPSGKDHMRLTVRAPPAFGSVSVIGSVLIDETIQPDDIKVEIQLQILGPDEHDSWYPCWMGMAP
jgi:hypothetical protein